MHNVKPKLEKLLTVQTYHTILFYTTQTYNIMICKALFHEFSTNNDLFYLHLNANIMIQIMYY